jgi:hypothetical protein
MGTTPLNRSLLAGAAGAALLFVAGTPAARAQGYRLRLDTRIQSVSFRGWTLDSIPAGDTVSTPGGGPVSPDGYAVQCRAAAAYCSFFRPGPERRSQPLTTTADLAMWGLGVTGLSVHGLARLGADVSGVDHWPGADPAFQLLAGYAQYARRRVTVRIGRQIVASRLGTTGFDGAGVALQAPRRGIDADIYVGWGLARGSALPITSPAVNPLSDFQPVARQMVAGAGAGWRSDRVDARLEYQREVDPRTDKFVSEQVALQAAVRPHERISVTAGADYDLAFGWWGSAEAALRYADRRMRAQVGLRRYRPHFDLWTIWGAFSPVPYHASDASLSVVAHRRLTVRGRYERYQFDATEAGTPLFQEAETDGWRWELGGTLTPATGWTVDGGYRAEYGPGAASAGFAGSVAYAPSRRLSISVLGSSVKRPLEYRFNEAVVRMVGIDAEFEASTALRLGVSASRYDESHDRPDAAAYDWDQLRLAARVVLQLGHGADLDRLPPSIRMLPGGRAER